MRKTAAVVACALVLGACGRQAPPAAADGAAAGAPPHLALSRVEAVQVPREMAFDGVLEAVSQSTVSAQAPGRILELPVDVNDTVQKGDVLARLRDAEPRARLGAAQAALREAQAEYARVKAVFDKKLIAQAQMDRATAARDAAQAAVDGAIEQEGHAVLRAPYAGIVVARQVQVGELAMPGQPVLTLLSLDRLRAVIDIPQSFVGAVRASAAARVLLADGTATAAGAIHVFPYADEHAHTFRTRVDLPDAGAHGLYPGELVKVAFRVGAEAGLAVPAAALAYRGEMTGLYVAGDGQRLEFRAVRLGPVLADGRVQVVAGVSAGEQVADDPVAAAAGLRRQEGGAP